MSARLTEGRLPIEEHLEALDQRSTSDSNSHALGSPAQIVTPPESPRSISPHPLEAHVMQLEEYEVERPPFYNKSTLAPDLIFSAESLRHDAKVLARILLSFLAFAIRTHGTTNSCVIGLYDRFEIWPGRPQEANSIAATVLNERNIVYVKALRYATRDMEERGLYIRKFMVKPDKKRKAMVAEWSIQMTPVVPNVQYPHHNNPARSRSLPSSPMVQLPTPNELVRLHHIAHSQSANNSRPPSRTGYVSIDRGESGLPTSMTPVRAVTYESRQGHRKTRSSSRPNEFGYYGNNCNIM